MRLEMGVASTVPEFLVRALFGAVLTGALNGFLSTWIILRRLGLATEALSHALFPGLAAALLLCGSGPVGMFLGGMTSALLVGGGSELIARTSRLKADAALAVLYAFAYAAGITLLQAGRVRFDITHWLFGDVFALANADLWLLWAAALAIVPLLLAGQRPLLLALLQADVARSMGVRVDAWLGVLAVVLVVAASVSFQAAGVVPIVALLLVPGATMRLLTDSASAMLWGGTALGAAGALGGVGLAGALNLPGGASIALLLGTVFLLAFIFAPRRGILAQRRREDHYCEESFQRWHRRRVPVRSHRDEEVLR